MNRFIGVDLGWYGKPSGLASLDWRGGRLVQTKIARLHAVEEILNWIDSEAGANAVVGVDAPLVIPNATGIRPAERELNRDFRRFHAGCHAANLGRPFAQYVTAFSCLLRERGFLHGTTIKRREAGRFQIEVHPHSAMVALFGLDRIVKYKKGRRQERSKELARLRQLILSLPDLDVDLPEIPAIGNLKPVEDMIDAVLCAYIAANWWRWSRTQNRVYGTAEEGYIVVPGVALKASSRPRLRFADR